MYYVALSLSVCRALSSFTHLLSLPHPSPHLHSNSAATAEVVDAVVTDMLFLHIEAARYAVMNIFMFLALLPRSDAVSPLFLCVCAYSSLCACLDLSPCPPLFYVSSSSTLAPIPTLNSALVLAVAAADGYVGFFSMEGEPLARQMFHVGPIRRLHLQPSLKLPDFAVSGLLLGVDAMQCPERNFYCCECNTMPCR